MPTDVTLLGGVPWFQPLEEREREELARVLDAERFESGRFVFKHGDPGESLYIVREGEVQIFVTDDTGHKIVLATAGPGQFFGEVSLLDNGPRTASAVAVADTETLRLDRDDLDKFLTARPAAAIEMLTVLGKRLRESNQRLAHTASRNVNDEVEDKRSVVQKAADWIAEFSGSMEFLLGNAAVFFVWIVVNLGLVPHVRAFDPFPFGLLTMAVSLEAIFLSIFVLISQNRQAAKDRVRADIEYDVNLKAELEIAHLHEKVDRLTSELTGRLASLERGLTRTSGVAAAGAAPASAVHASATK
jgi:CRP/FNR family cyclic AMP-dependent transcriptional regulator